MAGERSTDLVKLLIDNELLLPSQTEDLRLTLATRFPDARGLAGELLRRDWLTPFQANKLLQGKARELIVGPYRVLDRLGEGGMGQVYKAQHVRMQRIVALKVIHRDRLTSPTALERFTREVRAVAQLAHPNIVVAYEAGQDGDTHYLAMEYVEGQDLAQLVKDGGPQPIPAACDTIRQAALGLQHAHEKGLVHRDIKPGNLLLQNSRVVKILDFGLARFASETRTAGNLTQLGRVVGTVDYISPEQAGDPRKADIRSDIYSLGCCLFYLLAGLPPFEGSDMVARIAARVLGDAPPLQSVRPDAPAGLEQVLARMLERDPQRRYGSPAEVAAALEPFASVHKEAPQTKPAVAVAPVVRPAQVRLEPIVARSAPVRESPAQASTATELLIVRKAGGVRSGGWGWIAAACAALVLIGSGAAYWIFKPAKENATHRSAPESLAVNRPPPRVPPETRPKVETQPGPDATAEVRPESGVKTDSVSKPKSVKKTDLESKPVVAPKSEPKNTPMPPPAVPGEPELVPPPQVVADARPKPPLKPPTEVVKPADPRTPVPDGEPLTKAEATIRDLYKDDYVKVRHSELSAFAERLLEQADNSKSDPVSRYVLLREARDVAARAADAKLAYKAIDELAGEFAVNAREMKITALDRAVKEAHTAERSGMLADVALALIEEALGSDSYSEATRLAKLAETSAYRSGNADLITSTQTRRKELESLQKAYDDLSPALAVLADKPDDPDANLALGRFLCLHKGDWKRGLPHLARGGEGELQDLARKEGKGPETADQETEVADGWRDLARTERSTARTQLLLHALAGYQNALPRLAGLTKTKTEKSAEEIERELPTEAFPWKPQARFRGRWIVRYPNRTVREYLIDAKGNVIQTAEALQDANDKNKLTNIRQLKRAGKVTKNDNDFLLDFADEQLERLSFRGANLIVEHYNPRTQYPKQKPPLVGVGIRKR